LIKKWITNISLSIFSVLFILGGCEVIFRIYDANRGLTIRDHQFQTSNSGYVKHPHIGIVHRVPWNWENDIVINHLGFRGVTPESIEKTDGAYRIICIGGSTTFGVVAEDETYPVQLSNILNDEVEGRTIEVINAGVSSYTTVESLINLELRLLDYQPNMIVIYHAINDLRGNWIPNFKSDYTHYTKSWEYETTSEYLAKFEDVGDSFLEENSVFYWIVRNRLQNWVLSRIINTHPDNYITEPVREFKTAKPFKRNILNMIAIAKLHGIEVVLSSFALNLSKDWPDEKKQKYFIEQNPFNMSPNSIDETIDGIEAHNTVIREIAGATNVIFVDNGGIIPADESLFTDAMHPNAAGNALLARNIADVIKKNGISR
jgi:lysophospholipase L1-like esterase